MQGGCVVSSTSAQVGDGKGGGGTHHSVFPSCSTSPSPTQSDAFIASMLGANGGGPGRSASS